MDMIHRYRSNLAGKPWTSSLLLNPIFQRADANVHTIPTRGCQQTLNAWLEDPEELIKGQRMGFQVDDPQDRADLIAWLATLK